MPPPRTSNRRRKPSVLVHQVSVDEDDGGLYVQPAPRPVYQGGVRPSALRVKQLVDSDRATLDRDEICEAMDVDGKVSGLRAVRRHVEWKIGPEQVHRRLRQGPPLEVQAPPLQASTGRRLRVGKIPPRARKDVPARRVHWYPPACIFKSFERASKKTKTIDTIEEIEGFDVLHKSDQRDLAKRVDEWAAAQGRIPCTSPRRRRRAASRRRPWPWPSPSRRGRAQEAEDGPGRLRVRHAAVVAEAQGAHGHALRRAVVGRGIVLGRSSHFYVLTGARHQCQESMEMPLMEMPLDSLAYVDANDTLDGALLPSIFDEWAERGLFLIVEKSNPAARRLLNPPPPIPPATAPARGSAATARRHLSRKSECTPPATPCTPVISCPLSQGWAQMWSSPVLDLAGPAATPPFLPWSGRSRCVRGGVRVARVRGAVVYPSSRFWRLSIGAAAGRWGLFVYVASGPALASKHPSRRWLRVDRGDSGRLDKAHLPPAETQTRPPCAGRLAA